MLHVNGSKNIHKCKWVTDIINIDIFGLLNNWALIECVDFYMECVVNM